ncbi:MAG: 2-oxoacid:acceptor oxidoreductase family protein [Oscillospiraceae bacterium]|nr:2-oxoacid:acceptor oxidoreductase family protein [Oscillospiraceae bacterium]
MEPYSVTLPRVNENGYYKMRLESIGGLGANLCGKLLGELGAEYLGLSAASFSSYGSEKRGSPVKAYVRWGAPGQAIRHNSPVEQPHLLALFHLALGQNLPVTAGVEEGCSVVVNTAAAPEDARRQLRLYGGTLCCVDAQRLAMETKSRVNMILLGALARASGFIPLEAVFALIRDTLGKKYPSQLERNLAGAKSGYGEVRQKYFAPDGAYPPVPYREPQGVWGWRTAPMGGVNPLPGNLVSNDLSASREGYLPLFLPEKCIHCGLCDSTCPDMVFQFLPGEYRGKPAMLNSGLDYHHCKGCMRCVDVCPTGALAAGLEREHPNPRWQRQNRDLAGEGPHYEAAGRVSRILCKR